MKYEITKNVLSCKDFIDISQEDYKEVFLAKKKLLEVLNIEEKINLVLENYVEFEKELLNSSVDYLIFSGRDWSSSINEIHTFNRRLVNLLTTCRLYIDQVKHHINSIFDDRCQLETIKDEISKEYDSNIGYRVFEALRNYVQHRSLPISKIIHSSNRVEENNTVLLKNTLALYIDVERLKEDKRFKSSVLKEIETLGQYVEIKLLLRKYMESLTRIHQFIRDFLADKIIEWDNQILNIQNSYKQTYGDNILGLAVNKIDDNDKVVESVNIFDDFINRRQWLMEKNRLLINLASRIITNETETKVGINQLDTL